MARVVITGSAAGLGRLAAESLLDGGYDVIVHARDDDRFDTMQDLVARAATTVLGDLADLEQTRDVAGQVNQLGPVDAVIHNGGVWSGPSVLPPRSTRRPDAPTPHTGAARRQRRPRRAHHWRLLAPPDPARTTPRMPQHPVPGRTGRGLHFNATQNCLISRRVVL